jgi:hypothetical protein
MNQQDWRPPEARWRWLPFQREFVLMEEHEQDDVCLRLWEAPTVERDEQNRVVRHPNYVIFCDTAEGLEHGDYNAISVFNANTMEEVAAMETRYPVEYMGEVLEELAAQYYNALVVVERNNTGLVVVTYLSKEVGYPRLFRMPEYGQRKYSKRSERYGWATTQTTKPKMIHDFTRALRDNKLILHNERFRIQMQTFVRDGKGGYNATAGNHDDALIATLGAYQGVLDVGQYPTIFHDDENFVATWGDVLHAERMDRELNQERHPLEQPIGRSPIPKGQGYRIGVELPSKSGVAQGKADFATKYR